MTVLSASVRQATSAVLVHSCLSMIGRLQRCLTEHHLYSGMLVRCCRGRIRLGPDRIANHGVDGYCSSPVIEDDFLSMVEVSPDSVVFAELTGEHGIRRRVFVPIPVNSCSGLS